MLGDQFEAMNTHTPSLLPPPPPITTFYIPLHPPNPLYLSYWSQMGLFGEQHRPKETGDVQLEITGNCTGRSIVSVKYPTNQMRRLQLCRRDATFQTQFWKRKILLPSLFIDLTNIASSHVSLRFFLFCLHIYHYSLSLSLIHIHCYN